MHSIYRPVHIASWEELLALDGTCHYVAYQWIFLGQVGCEVHFLPLELLSNAKPWKSEVGTDRGTFHKV